MHSRSFSEKTIAVRAFPSWGQTPGRRPYDRGDLHSRLTKRSIFWSGPFYSFAPHQQRLSGGTLPRDSCVVGGAGGLALPRGFVNVCGIALPIRRPSEGAANALEGGRQNGHRLIRTQGVVACLRLSAVALAQRLPLLLEGPPGAPPGFFCPPQPPPCMSAVIMALSVQSKLLVAPHAQFTILIIAFQHSLLL